MDVRRLRYFAAVAELGSFTKAAERLHVAQPALSRQIGQLEQELGLELFSRAGRVIRTTDVGKALLRHVRTIERDFERMMEDMQARKEMPVGRVTLGLPPALAEVIVLGIIKRVRQAYPLISINIIEGISPVLAEWVQCNDVDLAMLGLAFEGDSAATLGLKLEVLFSEDMVVVEKSGTAGIPAAYSLAALCEKPLVLSDKFAMVVRSKLGLPDLPLNVTIEIDSIQAIKAMVLQGDVATILPISTVSTELRNGLVTVSPITSHGLRRQVYLAQPSFRQMTHAAHAVSQLIKDEIEQLQCNCMFSLSEFNGEAKKVLDDLSNGFASAPRWSGKHRAVRPPRRPHA